MIDSWMCLLQIISVPLPIYNTGIYTNLAVFNSDLHISSLYQSNYMYYYTSTTFHYRTWTLVFPSLSYSTLVCLTCVLLLSLGQHFRSDCYLTPKLVIRQPYHGEYELHFDEKLMMSTLYSTNKLGWIFIVLVYWNNSPRVDMSLHSDTISWFRHKSVFALHP
jgi:hypothetical protein